MVILEACGDAGDTSKVMLVGLRVSVTTSRSGEENLTVENESSSLQEKSKKNPSGTSQNLKVRLSSCFMILML
jgi:hypothetical protein